ncbi:hypothetical protein PNK_1670 [Candidatus Protochlamydia naegleriophila]|uniref:Uncharacterized protein n=1 Tax=Candidatus Protochlamydia naegleriophila TaxID=389348 RepID=A0A0U5JFU8_9BACT|nr:hypothetical protein [Candidatus Protochlamydia naegleriophila]CUI17279.1 hypothetical protein PNK_1670 [Candidatus Protochlamydia naegleriophila]
MTTYISNHRSVLLFELQQIVDDALNDSRTLQSEDCAIGEKAPVYTFPDRAPSQELPLMQRIWEGITQVSQINFSNGEEDLDDTGSAEALRIIRQRFGDEILPFSEEKSKTFQNGIKIVQLEEAIQIDETADQVQSETPNSNESLFLIPDPNLEDQLLPQNRNDRLLEIRREDNLFMQHYNEVMQRSEQVILDLEKQQGELRADIELAQAQVQDITENLTSINQQVASIIQVDEAIEEQIEDIRLSLSQVQLEQVELVHELTDRLLDVERTYEGIKSQEQLEYPHLYVISNLENGLTEVSSNFNTKVQETLHSVSETYGGILSLQKMRETISTFQGQLKGLPSLIKATIMGTIKESIKEASTFIWENFTNLGWKTIEAISNIGKSILQFPRVACSYVFRNVSVLFDRINLELAALSILSGCALVMTGIPFTFVATSVAGYLFIRRML